MNRKTINTLIFLGGIAIMSILFVQFYWIKKTVATQQKNVAIQEKEDSLNLKQFSEQVHVALRNVLQEISTSISDSSDLYGAVKQIQTNSFTVDIHEELHPYYLETLLKREFYSHNINQDFLYGIYDCFSDSVIFGNLIRFSKESLYEPAKESAIGLTSPKMIWKKDGHYFTVFFPNIIGNSIEVSEELGSPWIFMGVIVSLVVMFFAFAIHVILKEKRLSEVKTDFINNMTHELKTPIATIALSSDMLIKGDFSQDQDRLKRYASIIYKENKRLENQVERVLNVAKLNKDTLTLKKEELDIHELLNDIRENFEFNNTETGAHLVLNLNAEKHLVQVDMLHINNVLTNLIDNATKYCIETPVIEITTKNDKRGMTIEISDNGIGIKKDVQKMIFDKFYRVPTGNLHNVKGFGLGLYYVKITIEQHGGNIHLKSALGRGTTFYIWLPFK
jgi:two-component system phosphate regulon sensor histidine kinase PhoR